MWKEMLVTKVNLASLETQEHKDPEELKLVLDFVYHMHAYRFLRMLSIILIEHSFNFVMI